MGWFQRLFNRHSIKGIDSDRTEEILERYLDEDFTIFPMAESQTSFRYLNDIESQFGIRYPRDFVSHICGRFPGIYIEVKESVWPRPKEFEVGPFWSFLYGFHTFTASPLSEPWMRLRDSTTNLIETTGCTVSPVLRVIGDADVYCVDKAGKLHQYLHETDELETVALSFWELFEREVKALRSRKDRKRTEFNQSK